VHSAVVNIYRALLNVYRAFLNMALLSMFCVYSSVYTGFVCIVLL